MQNIQTGISESAAQPAPLEPERPTEQWVRDLQVLEVVSIFAAVVFIVSWFMTG